MTRNFNVRIFLSLALPWILLWHLPWAAWLQSLPGLRLGLAGLIFVAPGMAVSLLLTGNRLTLLSHFTSGLALSMFLVSSLGLMGRIAHLPFEFIRPTFFVVGLIALLVLTIHMGSTQQLFKPKSYSIISIVLLLLMIIFGAMISFTSRIESDSFTYLAYLTNWQHSPRLSFSEVFFGSGNLEPIRFWLAMFPMSLAFLAEVSNLHGVLLLGYYLMPVLVAISLLAVYNFYEDLLQSNLRAILALLLQFTFLFLLLDNRQPGNMFFLRITEDKSFAAFVLAPVFFLAVNCFLESHILRRGIFVLLSGWGLALVHPIILAYSIFIAGLYAAIVTITHKNYKTLGILLALLMFVIFPSASLRFVSLHGTRTQAAFDLESALTISPDKTPIGDRLSFIAGTPFYGFNLDMIKIQIDQEVSSPWMAFLLSWSYLWLIGLGLLWSLQKLKRQDNTIASFITAASLLVLLCAIPYTGWLAGYFVSARMLWRSPWLFPIGLVGVSLATDTINVIMSNVRIASGQGASIRNATFVSVLAICIVLIGYSSNYQYRTRWHSLQDLYDYKIELEQQAALGDYIETNIEQPSILLASYDMMNYLPGLSSKAKVVYYRNSIYTLQPVKRIKIEQVFSSDEDFSIKRRLDILRTYHVQYLLIEDTSLQEYYAAYPRFFSLQKFGNHWLFEYKDTAP
jgi:hypothetical protein